jgi:hypothetical protein
MFFCEAIALIEPKLCINHWKVLYKLCVFYVVRAYKKGTGGIHLLVLKILKISGIIYITRGSQEPVSFTWL